MVDVDEYPEDVDKCMTCGSVCCRKIVVEIDKPDDLDDLEDMKWYLYHPGIIVYLGKDGAWNIEMPIKCSKLDKDGKCTIYETRPPVCIDFNVNDCGNADDHSTCFRTAEDIDAYIAKLKAEDKLKPGKIFK